MHLVLDLFILAGISSICTGQLNSGCNVFPKDQYIEVGSGTKIMCQHSCTTEEIYWTLDSRRLDDSLSETLNLTHTVLSLSNFSNPTGTLQCHIAKTQQIIGGTLIRTYSKPRNILCILHNKLKLYGQPDQLNCLWEHQINPLTKVNYTVKGVFLFDSAESECKSQETNCIFKDDMTTKSLEDKVTFTVKAKTAAWEVSSDPQTFQLWDIYKISPPKDLNVTESSDQLIVSWRRSVAAQPCQCEVKCSKVSAKGGTVECERHEIENTSKSIPVDQIHGNVIIKNVESCIKYIFAFRCALDKASWSDWSKEKTYVTKPYMHNVKLRLWRKVSEPGKNGVRKVHAMWMGIPSTCEGTFTYKITQIPDKDKELLTEVNYTLCHNTSCDFEVNQDAHRINLKVSHNKAFLVEETVYVPAVGEMLCQVTNIQTLSDDGIILVSWKAPDQPVSGYMIDWTNDGNQYYWNETKYTNATLFDLLEKTPYNITVTPFFDGKTGHGSQTFQICSGFGDPGSITIGIEADHNSAIVSWTTTSQDVCSGAVTSYTVFYKAEKEPLLNVSVNGKMQKFILKDLNPDTKYTVYVDATALTGRSRSSERNFTTKKFNPRLLVALSISGSIIIVLVLGLGLCCAVQWKKFMEKSVPNPALSSVALWPQSHQKGIHFKQFSNPSESVCDTVYTEETQSVSTHSLATGWNDNLASDRTEDCTDTELSFAPHVQDETPLEPVETQFVPSPGESTAFLSSETSPVNPYRSQSSVESPVPRTAKQTKRIPMKQQERTPLKTVYVTLDMIEQDHGR